MKPFNLKTYLENPTRKIVTRDGYPARIICTDANVLYKDFSKNPNEYNLYSIVALVKKHLKDCNKDRDVILSYTNDGLACTGKISGDDLFFETVKVSGWVNIYTSKISGDTTTGSICKTKEEALSLIDGRDNYLDTIYIEWEE